MYAVIHVINLHKKEFETSFSMDDQSEPIYNSSKICDSCRKELTPITVMSKPLNIPSVSMHEELLDEFCDKPCDDVDDDYVGPQDLELINQCLKTIGETPVAKKKLVHTSYTKEKLTKIKNAGILPSRMISKLDDGHEIIAQLKEKFYTCTDRSQKVQILTILPKSWSVKRIQEEFSVTKKAKELLGINSKICFVITKVYKILPIFILRS